MVVEVGVTEIKSHIMRTSRVFMFRKFQLMPLAFSLLVCAGMLACGKSSSNNLTGKWLVVKASADTSMHNQSTLDAEVTAGTMEQGATMTFDANDSLTITMPPDNAAHQVGYTVLASGKQFVITGRAGHKDTLDFTIVGDTLRTKSKRLSITLCKGSVG
jgi:hypothetical protein